MSIRRHLAASLLLVFLFLGSAAASAQSLRSIVEDAEFTFGGVAYDAYLEDGTVEVELLSGRQIVEVLFDLRTGRLLETDEYENRRRVQRVRQAIARSRISLLDAIDAAEAAVGRGKVLEAELTVRGRARGRRYVIDIETRDGTFDIIVNARSGRIIRVLED